MKPNPWPSAQGTYGLILWLPQTSQIRVGRLGEHKFPAGWYAYWGSARGHGGIAARIRHHLALHPTPHWHLDWLRPHAHPVAVFFEESPGRSECQWVQQALTFPGAQVPVCGFGSQDCGQGCPAHLIYFGSSLNLNALANHLGNPEFMFIDMG